MTNIEKLKSELQKIGGSNQETEKSEPAIFGTLRIDKRVLETPTRAIAIRNISQLRSSTIRGKRAKRDESVLRLASYSFFVGLFLFAVGASTSWSSIGKILIVLGTFLLLASLVFRAYGLASEGYSIYRLDVSSNDGSTAVFTSDSEQFVKSVRSILTEKINKDDEASVFNVNFEKGVIETLNAGSLDVGALVQGDNNQVAANSPGAEIGTTKTTNTTNTTTTHNTSNTNTFSAENSPGAVVGTGNVAVANTTRVTTIDYGDHMRIIGDWRQFYAQQPETRHIEQRLSELERLMRAGTPDEPSRRRLRDVVLDLSAILQGYPAMVQVFRDIARLAGF